MELLQTIQYSYVNQCDNPMNIWLTEVAYVLVIVQPLIWNMVFLLRTKDKHDKGVFKLALVMCIFWILFNVFSRVRYNPLENKNNHCGFFNNDRTCTYRDTDSSHLYWKWTTAHFPDLSANYLMYLMLWFLPALLVKQHWTSVSMLMVSCAVGFLLTYNYGNNMFEFPAIWCYISIPVVTIGFIHSYLT